MNWNIITFADKEHFIMRTASIERNTKETKISCSVNIDGAGKSEISTGIGFFDHMLEIVSHHSLIDINIKADGDIHVDHVLPRKVVNHDKLWNLVLAHSFCNESKSDKLVNYYFIEKLINRNENIIGSRITRRKELILELGKNFLQRKKYIEQEYDNVKKILRNNF